MNVVTLYTKNLALTFSKENGSLIEVKSLISNWCFHSRAELDLSWRLHVPINEELKNHFCVAILGKVGGRDGPLLSSIGGETTPPQSSA